MGSVFDAATRAGAYDPKHYALGDNNTSINPNGQYPEEYQEPDNYQGVDSNAGQGG